MERLLLTRPQPDQATSALKLAELIAALSHALDITEGQPPGHCVRCCWIGMHVGRQLGLDDDALWALYYTLLLKDLGCSSNAARICQLYLTDDLNFKRDYKWVDGSLPKVLHFVFSHTGLQASLAERFKALAHIVRNGGDIVRDLIHTRCNRGADIARQLRFPEAVAAGIAALDEHWDGSGQPEGLAGKAIPIHARIALLAQVVDVFAMTAPTNPAQAALTEIRARRDSWFDPMVADAFEHVAGEPHFWRTWGSPEVEAAILALEPAHHEVALDEDYLDEIASAFGQVVDAKSPYTAGHSMRVALYTDLLGEQLGLPDARRRWLKRGALLHDVGKLGVSNAILDKPGKLDDSEWEAVRRHAAYTGEILSRIAAFKELAAVSAAHHEKLDGTGYPLGLAGEAIRLETRIITVADIFDAITAERPYRGAIPVPRALDMMAEHLGSAIDPACFSALRQVLDSRPDIVELGRA